jgi:hypothetical protein
VPEEVMSFKEAQKRQTSLPPGGYLIDREFREIVTPSIKRKAHQIVMLLMRKKEKNR